jgi:exopolysaccharide biosynthesis protein
MRKLNKIISLFLAVLLFCGTAMAFAYPPLEQGEKGPKVAALRQRLYDLGYLDGFKKTDVKFDETTLEALKRFQSANGLAADGYASSNLQDLLYSAKAIPAAPIVRSKEDVTATRGPQKVVALPELNQYGLLPPGSSELVYYDWDDGLWMYVSDSISVEIRRYQQDKGKMEWYEAIIKCAPGNHPYSVLSKNSGRTYQTPRLMAKQAGAVFAITDDFFGYRVKNKEAVGMVVRQGQVLGTRTLTENRHNLQPREVLALMPDGALRTFSSDMFTAQEYLDMGINDTWAFGPVLVQGGQIPAYFYSKDYRSYREPRVCLGMRKPGEYVALLVRARTEELKGAYFRWLAEKMYALGCTEAINLDGGNTSGMIFMGMLVNKDLKRQDSNIRKTSGIIAFGHTQYDLEANLPK